MSNIGSKFKMAAIAAIVILPIIGILMLARAKWVHQELPYLGETIVAADGTKEYHTVSDIQLINQHGQPISLDDFDSCIIAFSIINCNSLGLALFRVFSKFTFKEIVVVNGWVGSVINLIDLLGEY
jgi:hypothetical protein